MNKLKRSSLNKYIGRTDRPNSETSYFCNICKRFIVGRFDTVKKGWAKSQVLKKLVRDHILDKHTEVLNE